MTTIVMICRQSNYYQSSGTQPSLRNYRSFAGGVAAEWHNLDLKKKRVRDISFIFRSFVRSFDLRRPFYFLSRYDGVVSPNDVDSIDERSRLAAIRSSREETARPIMAVEERDVAR